MNTWLLRFFSPTMGPNFFLEYRWYCWDILPLFLAEYLSKIKMSRVILSTNNTRLYIWNVFFGLSLSWKFLLSFFFFKGKAHDYGQEMLTNVLMLKSALKRNSISKHFLTWINNNTLQLNLQTGNGSLAIEVLWKAKNDITQFKQAKKNVLLIFIWFFLETNI